MKYYNNGEYMEDLAPSCANTSMKVLAANKGVSCGWCGDKVLLFNKDIVVALPGVSGIIQFIYDHFGVRI